MDPVTVSLIIALMALIYGVYDKLSKVQERVSKLEEDVKLLIKIIDPPKKEEKKLSSGESKNHG